MKLPIPDDWNEEQDGYVCLFACIPNSPLWKAHYRGLFYQLTWWYVWDKDTGMIDEAKAIANQVYEGLCMANCDDFVNALNNISVALTAMGDLSELANIATNINTVNTTLAGIGDLSELANVAANVETLRATLEARSVAEVTAQNTNFTDLITAFNNYTPVQCSCGGSGCSSCGYIGGSQPASEPATEGQDPPINIGGQIVWKPVEGAPYGGQPGSSAYYNRKCKAANALHSDVVTMITEMNKYWVVEDGFNAAFAALGFVIAQATTPLFILDDVIAVIVGLALDIVLALLDQGVDLSDLETALNNNAEDLVCALYNTSSSDNALIEYEAVLDNAGVSVGNQALVTTLLGVDALNYMFYKGQGYFETQLANYTPPISCTACGIELYLNWGTIVSGTLNADGIPFQVETEIAPGNGVPHGFIEIESSHPVDISISGMSDLTPHPDTTRYPSFLKFYDGGGVKQDIPNDPPIQDAASDTDVIMIQGCVTDPAGPIQTVTITITEVTP